MLPAPIGKYPGYETKQTMYKQISQPSIQTSGRQAISAETTPASPTLPQVLKHVDNYIVFNEKLGGGQFSQVYKAMDKNDSTHQKYFAVKVIPMSSTQYQKFSNYNQLLQKEIEILLKARHENLICMHDLKQTPNNLYLFLDYCNGGDLRQYILKKKNRLAEEEGVEFFKQMCAGYQALNVKKIIHRDLKPENILLHEGKIKIGDFGFARIVNDLDQAVRMTQKCSPLYAPPQILLNEKYSSKCDVWSMGCIFFEMLFGKPPFTAHSIVSLQENIKRIVGQSIYPIPTYPPIAPESKDILTRMLMYNEKDRISWEEIFIHPILQKHLQKKVIENVQMDHKENPLYQSICKNIDAVWDNQVFQVKQNYPQTLNDEVNVKTTSNKGNQNEEQPFSPHNHKSSSLPHQNTQNQPIKNLTYNSNLPKNPSSFTHPNLPSPISTDKQGNSSSRHERKYSQTVIPSQPQCQQERTPPQLFLQDKENAIKNQNSFNLIQNNIGQLGDNQQNTQAINIFPTLTQTPSARNMSNYDKYEINFNQTTPLSAMTQTPLLEKYKSMPPQLVTNPSQYQTPIEPFSKIPAYIPISKLKTENNSKSEQTLFTRTENNIALLKNEYDNKYSSQYNKINVNQRNLSNETPIIPLDEHSQMNQHNYIQTQKNENIHRHYSQTEYSSNANLIQEDPLVNLPYKQSSSPSATITTTATTTTASGSEIVIARIEENKELSENEKYILYMKQIKLREAEKAFVKKIDKYFEFMRQRALFANATLLNFWNSSRVFHLSSHIQCSVLYCLCAYYAFGLDSLRRIICNEVEQKIIKKDGYNVYQRSQEYSDMKQLIIKDVKESMQLLSDIKPFMQREIQLSSSLEAQDFLKFLAGKPTKQDDFRLKLLTIFPKALQTIDVNSLDKTACKGMHMTQVFTLIDDFIPSKQYNDFDFNKFYDDTFNNPSIDEFRTTIPSFSSKYYQQNK